MPRSRIRHPATPRFDPEPLEPRRLLAVFVVTTTADTGVGSLRGAILGANASPGRDEITFALPGAGSPVINVGSTGLGPLPTITDELRIDGDVPGGRVVLRGDAAGANADGLRVTASGCVIEALVIEGFSDDGIDLAGSLVRPGGGNTVTRCHIGPGQITGGGPNGGDGIEITSSLNLIHLAFVVGNTGNGIRVARAARTPDPAVSNTIIESRIGPNSPGPAANGGAGVLLMTGSNTVGGGRGPFTSYNNVISGNVGDGVRIEGPFATGNVVSGNYIGTNLLGNEERANGGCGVRVLSANNVLGGTGDGHRNVIATWQNPAVLIQGAAATGNRLEGNRIGVSGLGLGADAIPASPNLGALVVIEEATDNTIGGLAVEARNVIAGSGGARVRLSNASRNVIRGNYIGTDAAGAVALSTGNGYGIALLASHDNVIGGRTSTAGNLISGNQNAGVALVSSSSNQVQGNRIGTRADGSQALGNGGGGVRVTADSNANLIGGAEAGAGNVISGNGSHGVTLGDALTFTASGNLVQGNFIGTNAAGTAALPNGGSGVFVDQMAVGSVIGGDVPRARNVISGNTGDGVFMASAGHTLVQGNAIGTNASGTSALGNGGAGVTMGREGTIGGLTAAAANVMAYNGGDGVYVVGGSANGILGNSIHSNGGLGIDLGPDGVTPNDPGDGDTGANGLLNFPVITSAASTAAATRVRGTVDGTPSTRLRVELFAGPSADGTAFGEGRQFLGMVDVMTDGGGIGSFDVADLPAVAPGWVVTATATREVSPDRYATSEFSRAAAVTAAPPSPPAVIAVFALGSAWSADFRNVLEAAALGDADAGFRLPLGGGSGRPPVLPWTNVGRFVVRFDRPVNVEAADLRVRGVRDTYAVTAASPLAGLANAYVFTLDRVVGADRLLLDLDGEAPAGVTAAGDGALLDGDRDGTPGGDFRFRVDVLPGDGGRSGAVGAADVAALRRRMHTTTAGPGTLSARGYHPFFDLNGDGRVNALDLLLLRRRLLTTLPAGEPV